MCPFYTWVEILKVEHLFWLRLKKVKSLRLDNQFCYDEDDEQDLFVQQDNSFTYENYFYVWIL